VSIGYGPEDDGRTGLRQPRSSGAGPGRASGVQALFHRAGHRGQLLWGYFDDTSPAAVKLSKKGEGWVVDFAVAGWTRPAQVSIITHLGKMLDKVKGKDVTIAKVGGRYDVQVIVPEEKLGDPGVVASFEALRKEISATRRPNRRRRSVHRLRRVILVEIGPGESSS
jgi:hypothetical protein